MATAITHGGTLPDSSNKADFYALIDSATIATIADTDMAQITTASKVSGTAITGLASLPAGAGVIPVANVPSGISKARVHAAGDQDNLTSGLATKVVLDTEGYDVSAEFANSKFTVTVAGYYLIAGQVCYNDVIADKLYQAMIYVDGAQVAAAYSHASAALDITVNVVSIEYLTVGKYIELYALQGSGANTVDITAGAGNTYLCVHRLS